MVNFFNRDEQGIEGVAGAAGAVVNKTVKTVSDQVGNTAGDFFKQLLGDLGSQDQDAESGTEMSGQASGKGRAGLKSKKNVHNPVSQQALLRQKKLLKEGNTSEDIERLEKLRKTLHDEQVKELFQPKKQQEENMLQKNEREEQEKKQKKQLKQQEEVKKKEDLSVVQKRTGIENKGWGAG